MEQRTGRDVAEDEAQPVAAALGPHATAKIDGGSEAQLLGAAAVRSEQLRGGPIHCTHLAWERPRELKVLARPSPGFEDPVGHPSGSQ